MAKDTSRLGFATRAIHAGQEADPATGATVVPIYATSTYTQAAPGKHKGFEYSRTGNPTRAALETCLAALEGGERGLAFASGLAATTAVLSLLKPADEVAASADLYGGPFRLFERVFKPWGLVTRYTEDPSPTGFAQIINKKTKLVWVETPTNPLLQIVDIAAVAELSHKVGAPLAVDNTFASPYLQQPLKLGADIVVHSTTKYLGGHSDVVGGAVIGRKDLLQPIAFFQNAAGGVPGPFDAYLTLRGLKTLAIRMERQCPPAGRVADDADAGRARLLSGAVETSRSRSREAADARLRRHDQPAPQGRYRRGEALPDENASLQPGGEPRRCRVARLPSGD